MKWVAILLLIILIRCESIILVFFSRCILFCFIHIHFFTLYTFFVSFTYLPPPHSYHVSSHIHIHFSHSHISPTFISHIFPHSYTFFSFTYLPHLIITPFEFHRNVMFLKSLFNFTIKSTKYIVISSKCCF